MLLVPNITVRAEPHPTEAKTEHEDEFEYEYDWGTRRSEEARGRSQRACFFEPGNCPCLSNRSEEVGIARPKRGSNLAIVPQLSL
jgi:hypothetical protein